MKRLFLLALCALFYGCGDTKSNAESKTYATELVQILPKAQDYAQAKANADANAAQMLENLQKQAPQNIIDDALALVERANIVGYKLILPQDLAQHLDEFNIIATLPRGVYNLGLIPNAKHFAFALSPTLNENGSEWNWEADGLNRAQSEFIAFLGEDKNAKIVFYDSGEHILSPMGSANVALLWAKHLGYNNIYLLAGGFNAYKELGLQISTQAPHCCEM